MSEEKKDGPAQEEITNPNPTRVLLEEKEIIQFQKLGANNVSLAEAARLEVVRLSSGDKTPVSLMQDLLSRRGTVPKYELIQIEGAINEPIFKFSMSVASESRIYVAIGSGKSKKGAKHNAAKARITLFAHRANICFRKIAANKCLFKGVLHWRHF